MAKTKVAIHVWDHADLSIAIDIYRIATEWSCIATSNCVVEEVVTSPISYS